MPPVVQPLAGNFYIGTSLTTVSGWSATVDSSQGLPAAGVQVGAGPNWVQDPGGGPFKTQRYAPIYKHPTLSQWAYPSDPTADAALTGTAGLPTPAALTPDWAGASVATASTGLSTAAKFVIAAGIALAVAGTAAGLMTVPKGTSGQPTMPDSGAILDSGDAE